MAKRCATAEWIAQLDKADATAIRTKVEHGAAIQALHRVAKDYGAPGLTVFREHWKLRCVCEPKVYNNQQS